ncbi:hypothetical protein PT015_23275 [Candidatus Mycobacterium wuenschmannii]|uniref:Uncharacterized protein n=1 Tax=Candidatus Mycobacterium wuenschmannii TaxID=3027808 RepID=A0ABY8VX98_9MYCO|nr:hypothetical protein [Candidatus Mycobacterium wuenschmannii]WIM87716.1 hypothetical protein PT015_23275 [Candidatus Mycobacterium wuenschmannii]
MAGRQNPKVVIEQRIGPWQVALAWPDDADQGGPVEISIKPYADATDDELIGGLSSTVLRHIDFRAAREKWVAIKAHGLDRPDGLATLRDAQLRKVLERDGVTDTYLALLANAYIQLTRAGESSVSKRLAEATGRSPDTIKQHLHRVRKEGMLTAISGKAGGLLTMKAVEIIRAAGAAQRKRDEAGSAS